MSEERDSHIVKITNIRKKTRIKDILEFFDKCKVKNGEKGVHIVHRKRNGASVGFVELETDADITEALKKNNHFIDTRCVQVSVSNITAVDETIFKFSTYKKQNEFEDQYVTLTGFPFNTSRNDLVQFFAGLDVIDGSIFFDKHPVTGKKKAHLQFKTKEMAEQALQKDRAYLRNSCIRVLPSNFAKISHYVRERLNNKRVSPRKGITWSLTDNLKGGIVGSRSYHTDIKYYPNLKIVDKEKLTTNNFEQGAASSAFGNFRVTWSGFSQSFKNNGGESRNNSLAECFRAPTRNFHYYNGKRNAPDLVSPVICSWTHNDNQFVAEADSQFMNYNFTPIRFFGKLNFPSIFRLQPRRNLIRLLRMALK